MSLFFNREAERLELPSDPFFRDGIRVEKNRLLASLRLAWGVVPSDFENFGMIVAEAVTPGGACYRNDGSPWQELETERCGWWVGNDTDTLTEAVREALELDKDLLHEMGKRGRQLILRKYTMDAVSLQLVQMYDWITGKINTPGFISELNQE